MLRLELDPRSGEHVAIIRCTGRIVFHDEAKNLADVVRPLIEKHDEVVLDLSDVRDVDSAGLGTLASLHLFARARNRVFALQNPRAFVSNLLELTQLDRQLRVVRGNDSTMECAA
jgi:anti-anti-sigma factor